VAKDGVVGGKVAVAADDEELAAVGIGARVGRGDGAPGVVDAGEVLVREVIARAASAAAGGVTALQHLERGGGGQAVAFGAVEVEAAGQVDHRVDRAGGLDGVQAHGDGGLTGLAADGRDGDPHVLVCAAGSGR